MLRDQDHISGFRQIIKIQYYNRMPLNKNRNTTRKRGGTCPCNKSITGGYKPTKRNLKYLKKWKKGKSIGFTMRSSLKAKGLIPRANGTKRVSAKYSK
jgi:hypothetical protein